MIKVNKSTIWGETYYFMKQYKCTLAVYFITILFINI